MFFGGSPPRKRGAGTSEGQPPHGPRLDHAEDPEADEAGGSARSPFGATNGQQRQPWLCSACWLPFASWPSGRHPRLLPCLHVLCQSCLAGLPRRMLLRRELGHGPPVHHPQQHHDHVNGQMVRGDEDEGDDDDAVEMAALTLAQHEVLTCGVCAEAFAERDVVTHLSALDLLQDDDDDDDGASGAYRNGHGRSRRKSARRAGGRGGGASRQPPPQCAIHVARRIKARCDTCDVNVCVDCLLQSSQHSQHRLVTLDEGEGDAKSKRAAIHDDLLDESDEDEDEDNDNDGLARDNGYEIVLPVRTRRDSERSGFMSSDEDDEQEQEQGEEGEEERSQARRLCYEHRHELRAVCAQCHRIVCTSCVLHDGHAKHTLLTLDEALKRYTSQLGSRRVLLLSSLEALDASRGSIVHALDQLEAHQGAFAAAQHEPGTALHAAFSADIKTLQLQLDNVSVIKDYTLAAAAVVQALLHAIASSAFIPDPFMTVDLARIGSTVAGRTADLLARDPTLSLLTKGPSSIRADGSHGLRYDTATIGAPRVVRSTPQFRIQGPRAIVATGDDNLIVVDFPNPQMLVVAAADGAFRYSLFMTTTTLRAGIDAVAHTGDVWTVSTRNPKAKRALSTSSLMSLRGAHGVTAAAAPATTLIECYSPATHDGGGKTTRLVSFECEQAVRVLALSSGDLLVGQHNAIALYTNRGGRRWVTGEPIVLHSSVGGAVLLDSGEIAVCNPILGQLVVLSEATGNIVRHIGSAGGMATPISVAYSRDSEVLFVVEEQAKCVSLWSAGTGQFIRRVGESVLQQPVSVAVLSNGSLAVADAGQQAVLFFSVK